MTIKTVLGLLLCSLGSSCGSTKLMQVDQLNRDLEVKTILVGERYSLYSPFDRAGTAPWVEMVDEEWQRVSTMFGDPPIRPTPIQILGLPLKRIENGDTVTIAMPDIGGHHGYTHYASEQNAITVIVGLPTELRLIDDRAFTLNLHDSQRDRMILRHELCHLFYRFCDWPLSKNWFNEGLAYESMWMRPNEDGELELAPASRPLHGAADLEPAAGALAPLLSATELSDSQLLLSQAFVRFLIERSTTEPPAAIHYIGGKSDDELLELEAEWLEWLRQIAR